MDLAKLRDYMIRLQQAHQQAVQSGDKARADQFAAIADQAMAHAKAAMEGPGGPKGAAGTPGQGPSIYDQGIPTLGQLTTPKPSVPPDVAREAQGESQGLQGLFSAPGSVAPTAPAPMSAENPMTRGFGPSSVPPEAATQIPVSAAMGGQTVRSGLPPKPAKPQSAWERVVDTINKIPFPALGANVSPTTGWNDAKRGYEALMEEKYPAHPTVQQAKEQVKWKLNPHEADTQTADMSGYGFEEHETPKSPGDIHDEETRLNPTPTAKPVDPYAALGEDPSKTSFADAIGLLLGGKNYLNFKDRQIDNYQNKRYGLMQQLRQEDQAGLARKENHEQMDKSLGIQYTKMQQEQAQKAQEDEDKNARAEMEAYSRSTAPGELDKIPGFQNAKARLIRQKQIEAKKGN